VYKDIHFARIFDANCEEKNLKTFAAKFIANYVTNIIFELVIKDYIL
jgi:hypothetical protein